MVRLRRLDNIHLCVERVLADGIPADLIETGVWRGGSCAFMRAMLRLHGATDRSVWAADSFQGMSGTEAAARRSTQCHVEERDREKACRRRDRVQGSAKS